MEYREIEPRMKAALFDMDGTLLDSMMDWRGCNIEFLEGLGCRIPPEMTAQVLQCTGSMLAQLVRETFGVEFDRDAFVEHQKRRMHDAYTRGVAVKPGVREYLDKLRRRGVLVVLTSATWTPHTELALARTGMRSYFDVLCCTDAIGSSKRTPAFFDKVSERIGHPKSECVLFEDALYALKGGREAGLLGEVAVSEPLYEPFRAEIRAIADVFVDSLAELV